MQPTPSQADLYKCTISGRVVYQDQACPGQADAKPYQFKAPLNTVTSQSLTGKAKEKPDNKPAWLKPLNPIEDCKAKGGTFNPEFRACQMP